MKEYDDELVSADGVTVGSQRSQKSEASRLFMYFDLAM